MRGRKIFRYPKRDNISIRRLRRRWALLSADAEVKGFLFAASFCFHNFSIFASPGRLDGGSVGTHTCDPRSARAVCSSNWAFALNLISSKTRTSVAISQVVKQIISVASGNDLRRGIGVTELFGGSPASDASSGNAFMLMTKNTCAR